MQVVDLRPSGKQREEYSGTWKDELKEMVGKANEQIY